MGSHLVKAFAEQKYRVGALVRSTSSAIRLGNANRKFELLVADTLEEIGVAVENFLPDVIVHTACSYGRKGETTFDVFQANVALGMSVLQASISLGKQTTLINTGTVLPSDANLYALTKNQFSELGKRNVELNAGKLQFIDVALQHMYGPHDDISKFTTFVIRGCGKNVDSLALTKGDQRRDFIFIDDVVSGYQTLIGKRQAVQAYERIEMGSGSAVEIKDFVQLVKRVSGANTILNFGAVLARANDPEELKADISRLSDMGWKPLFTLEQGIKKSLENEGKQ